jgi:hypothetical protein
MLCSCRRCAARYCFGDASIVRGAASLARERSAIRRFACRDLVVTLVLALGWEPRIGAWRLVLSEFLSYCRVP